MKKINGVIVDLSYDKQTIGILVDELQKIPESANKKKNCEKVFADVSEQNLQIINDRLINALQLSHGDMKEVRKHMKGEFTIDGNILSSYKWEKEL